MEQQIVNTTVILSMVEERLNEVNSTGKFICDNRADWDIAVEYVTREVTAIKAILSLLIESPHHSLEGVLCYRLEQAEALADAILRGINNAYEKANQ